MTTDPFAGFKAQQREMWGTFAPTATFTTQPAARLIAFAAIQPNEDVLDVGTGTGVAAITAARTGARVAAVDLTPALLEHARENGRVAGVDVEWKEGDAEQIPFPDGAFDVVVSQFAHMFAPRPDVVVREMRRVLKPGGRLAFSTWPPDDFVGRLFAFVGRNLPPPPPGAAPPPQWGDRRIVAERLAPHFETPVFGDGTMEVPALSPAHYRLFLEHSVGPITKIVALAESEPERLATLRAELDGLIAEYFADNTVRQRFLMTRASSR
ncbi:MAG TPA: class I SAM-dependent methyltransferase [Vicinamibacterales bacterium]|jgi:SAM-dependent methyltransferase|nr:class I SAM-dependent methyltransferase [Vicinamibacterales bacterium]